MKTQFNLQKETFPNLDYQIIGSTQIVKQIITRNFFFSVNLPSVTHTHTIMDVRNDRRRNGLTHTRFNFRHSGTTSSCLRGGEGVGGGF